METNEDQAATESPEESPKPKREPSGIRKAVVELKRQRSIDVGLRAELKECQRLQHQYQNDVIKALKLEQIIDPTNPNLPFQFNAAGAVWRYDVKANPVLKEMPVEPVREID